MSERADLVDFVDIIRSSRVRFHELFLSATETYISRAPGRLDVMGGIADYSGSLVLPMPIAEATFAAVQKRNDRSLKIVSLLQGGQQDLVFETQLDEILDPAKSYAEIGLLFSRNLSTQWAAYVAGIFSVLARERNVEFSNGASILIASNVPVGKGVSSSAAIEVAVMQAVCSAFELSIEPLEKALLCQKAENKIAGAPCGAMDQIASNSGVENALLAILCQPAIPKGVIPIPENIELWGIDSGVRHAVSGSDYSSVRIGAFMGYRIIADLAGLRVGSICEGLVDIEDHIWSGYLCNVTREEFSSFERQIPIGMSGAAFLEKYGGTTDRVTQIDPGRNYSVRAAAAHAVRENTRVSEFSELLRGRPDEKSCVRMGELMFGSHNGYRSCGLTEPCTERLIELATENLSAGVFGARITGGGSGGTVVFLTSKSGGKVIREIAAKYASGTGREPHVFFGSSPGADKSGIHVLH